MCLFLNSVAQTQAKKVCKHIHYRRILILSHVKLFQSFLYQGLPLGLEDVTSCFFRKGNLLCL